MNNFRSKLDDDLTITVGGKKLRVADKGALSGAANLSARKERLENLAAPATLVLEATAAPDFGDDRTYFPSSLRSCLLEIKAGAAALQTL